MTPPRYLCAEYTGPETWANPKTEWTPRPDAVDPCHAAESYAEDDWTASGCEYDPTKKPAKIAVLEPATGRRWVVTVEAEYVMTWTGREEEVPPEGDNLSAEWR